MIAMDRAENAANQWARERPEIDTEAMVLLGRLAEAALVILRNSTCSPANSTCWRHCGEAVNRMR
jgi:hypothetical protein